MKKTNVSRPHGRAVGWWAHGGAQPAQGDALAPRAVGELLCWGRASLAHREHGKQEGHLQGPDQLHGQVPFWHEADDGDG